MLYRYGRVVGVLDTDVVVMRTLDDLGVDVTVNASQSPVRDALWVQWDVTQDQPIQLQTAVQSVKVLEVVLVGKDVVVTHDQVLLAVQFLQGGKEATIDHDVT